MTSPIFNLSSRGEMSALIASRNWSASPLSSPDIWSQSLKTTLGVMLGAQAQIVLFWGPEFIALYNDAYAPTIGDKHPHALGRPAAESWAELWDDLGPLLRGVRETGETFAARDRPFYIERHGGRGETVYFDVSYSIVADDDGSAGGVLCIVSETTERVLAEREIKESGERFRAFVTASSTSIYDMSADWREMRHLDGRGLLADTELPRTNWLDAYIPLDDQPRVMAAITEAIDTKSMFELEHRVRLADGSLGWIHSRAVPILDDSGQVLEWFGAASDVSKRKRMEIALRESEARLRFLGALDEALGASSAAPAAMRAAAELLARNLQASRCAYAAVDADNDRFTIHEDHTQPGLATSAGTYSLDLFGPRAASDMRGGRTLVVCDVAQELAPGEGREMFLSIGIQAIVCCPLVKDDRLVAMMAVHQDEPRRWHPDEISLVEATVERCWAHVERVGAEARLRESEEFTRRVLQSSADCIKVLDLDGRLEFMSEGGMWVMEVEDFGAIKGACWPEFWSGAEHGKAIAAIEEAKRGGIGRFQGPANTMKGTPRWWDVIVTPMHGPQGAPQKLLSVSRDITATREAEERLRELNETLENRVTERTTELLRAEEALRQAQKMEAVGQLTGGVAHDFNNLLTIIKSSTELLRRPDLPEERRRRYVEAISETVDRAAKLTGQLLAFARRQALKPEVFDPAARIRDIADMLRSIVGSRIQIITEARCGDCLIEADVSQFETALINMAVNARDAMEEEGVLTIRVESVSRLPPIRGHRGGQGGFVGISLTDTGHGIKQSELHHIFEPFYTTKEVGKGTGLGLSQVYGFAKQSGGDIAVESEPDVLTRFTLYLPRAESASALSIGSIKRDVAREEIRAGRRVLVVEDNVEVGTFSTQLLRDLGYETSWAANAAEALMALAGTENFDVVFSDVVMPGMSGIELAEEIRRRHPGMPIVLTSGYSHILANEGRHGFELLHKPYAVEELSNVLWRLMRDQPASAG